MFQSFNDLNIPSSLKDSLKRMGFITPTPIQAAALPAALIGKDVVGTAQTGTGKTAAFGIPLLTSLCGQPGKKALILAPTRELAAQIHRVLKKMGEGSSIKGSLVVGGESFFRQSQELAASTDYIVATPGRLNDHLDQRTVNLSEVAILVLDEVDRMLDLGFLPQIRNIVQRVPSERQTLLFSATLPQTVERFMGPLVRNPVRVSVGDTTRPISQVIEKLVHVKNEEKTGKLLEHVFETKGKVLVFVRTKSRTRRVMQALDKRGCAAVCLHGGRTQGQRKQALDRFRSGSHPVMVATDLAGRGLDIEEIDHVINFDVPATREDYIHRIGRTGRAGNSGRATSFVVEGNLDEERIVSGKSPAKARRPFAFSGGPRRKFSRRR